MIDFFKFTLNKNLSHFFEGSLIYCKKETLPNTRVAKDRSENLNLNPAVNIYMNEYIIDRETNNSKDISERVSESINSSVKL